MDFSEYLTNENELLDEFGESLSEKRNRFKLQLEQVELDQKYISEVSNKIKLKKKQLENGLVLINKKMQDDVNKKYEEFMVSSAERILTLEENSEINTGKLKVCHPEISTGLELLEQMENLTIEQASLLLDKST